VISKDSSLHPDDIKKLEAASHVIFPGVGAAGDAMVNLREKKLDGWLKKWIDLGRPLLGICLGTQIILDYSEENDTKCVGLVVGSTKRFPEQLAFAGQALKIPHMGWNSVELKHSHPVFNGVAKDAEFYTGRGVVYDLKGEYNKAIEDLSRAIAIDPKCASAYSNRGAVYREKGEYEKAAVDEEKYRSLSQK